MATSGFVWVKGAGEQDFHKVRHHQTYNHIAVESEFLYGAGHIRLNNTPPYNLPLDQHNLGGIFMAENDSQVIYVMGNAYWPRMYGNKTFVTENAGQTWEKRFQVCDWDNGYIPWPADRLEPGYQVFLPGQDLQ